MFVFDRHEPAEAVYKALADIAPDGAHYVIDNSPFGTTYIEDRLQADSTGRRIAPIMSVARPTQVLDFDDPGASATAVLSRGNTQCKGGPSFVSYWAQTTSIKDKDYFIRLETELDAAGDVAIVDSRTFAYLYRAAHGAGNENRATVFAPPTLRGRPGEAFSVEVEVRNDGWNAWTPSYELAVEPLPADGHEATPIAVSRLGQTVEPGASLSVNLAGRVPEGKKGSRLLRYRLRPDEPPHFPAGDAFLQKLLIEP
jgi:hypothetical protein